MFIDAMIITSYRDFNLPYISGITLQTYYLFYIRSI